MSVNLPKNFDKSNLKKDYFCKYFEYNESTGKIYWKPRRLCKFKTSHQMNVWNSRYAYKEAGSLSVPTKYGYRKIQITLFSKTFSAHRIIAVMTGMMEFYGEKLDVDHIDGDPTNNRIHNIRIVSRTGNARNRKRKSNSSSKCCGVYFNPLAKKWHVTIGRGKKKSKNIGYFDDWFDAVCARKSQEAKLNYSSRHGK